MPLQATSGAASYDAFGGGVAAVPNYIEECFSAFLYTGNGSTQTITNNIDLSTKGGLVWLKGRNALSNHRLVDSARGNQLTLTTNNTAAQYDASPVGPSLTSSGFTLGNWTDVNDAGNTYVSWTFRKQPKFFDVVTYTGTGSVQNISHNLGSAPACMIVKDTTNAGSAWAIYHTSLGNTQYLQFTTSAAGTSSGYWNNTSPTSTQFTVGTNGNVNQSGATYVAYLYAHNAGGFGLTGTDNVISCGSFTQGSGDTAITLGYEPQWVMIKNTNTGGSWVITDNMRAMPVSGSASSVLNPDLSNAESSSIYGLHATATGFISNGFTSGNFIYIAIRRGPMKVPTSGTSVFTPIARTGTGANATVSGVGFPPDLFIGQIRGTAGYWNGAVDRLRGVTKRLVTSQTNAEDTTTDAVTSFTMDGSTLGIDSNGFVNESGKTYIEWNFRRAPSFFDEVCYTGTGTGSRAVTHNLGVAPEMVIVKQRTGTPDHSWWVLTTAVPLLNILNSTEAANNSGVPANLFGDSTYNNYIAPTATTVTLSPSDEVNKSGNTYVQYLFATCLGVSKVGSYTGTGTTLQVNCGFAAGARFVLIKRTDSTGSWYVWDVARGISSGNDPYLLLNSTAAEVTNTDYIDAYSAGFEISSTAPAEINASGGSFIFLAIS